MSRPREHPLCPECGYDLVGSASAGGRVCPECGCEFTLNELVRAARAKWTPAIGYRRAVISLIVKSLFILPACTALLWLVTPKLFASQYWGIVLVLAVAGFALGFVLCLNLSERANLATGLLGLIAAAFAWANVLAAATVSHFLLRSLPDWPAFCAQTTVAIFASIWIFKEFVLE